MSDETKTKKSADWPLPENARAVAQLRAMEAAWPMRSKDPARRALRAGAVFRGWLDDLHDGHVTVCATDGRAMAMIPALSMPRDARRFVVCDGEPFRVEADDIDAFPANPWLAIPVRSEMADPVDVVVGDIRDFLAPFRRCAFMREVSGKLVVEIGGCLMDAFNLWRVAECAKALGETIVEMHLPKRATDAAVFRCGSTGALVLAQPMYDNALGATGRRMRWNPR